MEQTNSWDNPKIIYSKKVASFYHEPEQQYKGKDSYHQFANE